VAVSGLSLAAAVKKLLAKECRKHKIPLRSLRSRNPLVHCKPLAGHRADAASTTFAEVDHEVSSRHAGHIVSYSMNRSKVSALRMREKDWVELRMMSLRRVVGLYGALRLAAPVKKQLEVRLAAETAETQLKAGKRLS
jgi:hypothetical protein